MAEPYRFMGYREANGVSVLQAQWHTKLAQGLVTLCVHFQFSWTNLWIWEAGELCQQSKVATGLQEEKGLHFSAMAFTLFWILNTIKAA